MKKQETLPGWRPDWPVPQGVHALCTTRAGGVSLGAWQGLNLGTHVGDRPDHVAENRARLHRALGVRPVFLTQVHGTQVLSLDPATVDDTVADACITAHAGVACTIMVADCLPVLFADLSGQRVAAAHAGWRGLAAGVLERTAQAFESPERTIAWLGPCIGPDAFEVGEEVRAVFVAAAPNAERHFRPADAPGKWWADLPGLARDRLQAAGVGQVYGNDGSAPWCTAGNPSVFFSHRRDGVSGRLAACIWRD
ncbi:peptidoglycan editing factor PgeF [Variovorax ginsengisoli]|uniref:Purine nucleoside phosphorylase n=1 Tax=Variovorax ginsengisoli TaxID=363844 RepID=A0ABT9S8J2_9BURK|nr:peptidoglycan editing factor PgeF [Variovorax ginsengisoli]MDP9900091.1 YfiH family protein [Variovorax ginsengisoli]